MNCVKCGRETAEERVFCDLCLEEMEKHPVDPRTAVYIPRRTEEEPRKIVQRKKPVLTPSEQVLRLKKKLRRTRIALVLALLLCGALCFVVGRAVEELDFQRLLGQNYHTVDPLATAPASETTAP